MGTTAAGIHERELLAAARGGDEHAFRRLVELHGRELHSHCYRMMGYLTTSANGQPALATYCLDANSSSYLPIALDVLTLRGPRIAEVAAFRTPEVFPRFGLPSELGYAATAL